MCSCDNTCFKWRDRVWQIDAYANLYLSPFSCLFLFYDSIFNTTGGFSDAKEQAGNYHFILPPGPNGQLKQFRGNGLSGQGCFAIFFAQPRVTPRTSAQVIQNKLFPAKPYPTRRPHFPRWMEFSPDFHSGKYYGE